MRITFVSFLKIDHNGMVLFQNIMESLTHFIFELSVLKKLPRSGSFITGIKDPDSVAGHVFRATQIAFFLAELEGGRGERAAFLVSIHDNAEARIGDLHKIAQRYLDHFEAEKKAFFDQVQDLPSSILKKYQAAFEEFGKGKTIEAKCAKDADLLELAFQAKEHLEQGYLGKKNWLDNIESALGTGSAKKIFEEMKNISSNDWWKNLKKI